MVSESPDSVEGPLPNINEETVNKAILKMKSGKAGIVGKMILASNGACTRIITNLINAIIRSGRVPSDWNNSHIISLFKGKGDALERGNYRGLKLLYHVMKILEHIVEQMIRDIVSIEDICSLASCLVGARQKERKKGKLL